jgi:hypothetical protein
LACPPGRVLSTPAVMARLGGPARGRRSRGVICRRGSARPSSPLHPRRLVLVPGHPGAGHRPDPGRRASPRGSLHLHSDDWAVHRAGLGGLGNGRPLAPAEFPPGQPVRAGGGATGGRAARCSSTASRRAAHQP